MNPAIDYERQLAEYTQRVFRNLLDCMARPGKINRIEPFPLNYEAKDKPCAPYILGIAYTLLDIEVEFRVIDQESVKLTADLEFHTNARPASLAAADYLFMDPADDPLVLKEAKQGNPDYPDLGATVIMSVDDLSEKETADDLQPVFLGLSGPGIAGEKDLFIVGAPETLFVTLQEINNEFPLGIDLILVSQGKIACLPRSSIIKIRRTE